MYHFEKKNSKIFFPEGPHENVWSPARMFPRVPLWLSTGLGRSSFSFFRKVAVFVWQQPVGMNIKQNISRTLTLVRVISS